MEGFLIETEEKPSVEGFQIKQQTQLLLIRHVTNHNRFQHVTLYQSLYKELQILFYRLAR